VLLCPLLGPEPAVCSNLSGQCTARRNNRRTRSRLIARQASRRRFWPLFLLFPCISLAFSGCGGGAIAGASSEGIEISPSTLSFGSVAIGKTASASVSLINLNSSPIQISAINVSSPAFTVSTQNSLPITVAAAGGTYALSVTFNPSVSGAATGSLSVTTNSASDSSAVVGLSGMGLAVAPALNAFTCSSNSIPDTGTDSCTVTLSTAAASGGMVVNLLSSSAVVSVPASVTVPEGATSANFLATASVVSSPQAVTLTASAGGVSDNTDVEVEVANPSLTLSGTSLAFGSVAVNTAATQTLTVTSTGAAAVTINSATVTGAGFTVSTSTFPITLNPGSSTSFTVQFDPTAAGASTGQFTVGSDSTDSTAVSLTGTGVPVLTGISCTNSSMTGAGTDACSVALNAAAASGGFTVNLGSNNAAVSVPSTVTVPANSATGSFSASVSAVSTAQAVLLTATAGTASQSFTLDLNAAAATLTVNATTIAFGNVDLNSPATQSVTLTSTGALPVTVSSVTISGTGFTFSGSSFPLTLNSTTPTATLSVQFDPTTAGAATGQLTIASNSSTNPTANVSLTGTGVSGGAYEVQLSWDPPVSSPDPVASYNIYRSPSGSSSYQLMGSVTSSYQSYTDTDNIQDGSTYDYIVESVDSSGNESVPSNMASVTIP
jgi:hypothetical protein